MEVELLEVGGAMEGWLGGEEAAKGGRGGGQERMGEGEELAKGWREGGAKAARV